MIGLVVKNVSFTFSDSGIKTQIKMNKKSVKKVLKDNALTLATLAGVLIGIILGVCLRTRDESYTKREVMYVKFLGTLFLSMLKSIIIPLIIPSLIVAVGSLDLKLSGMYIFLLFIIFFFREILKGSVNRLLENS